MALRRLPVGPARAAAQWPAAPSQGGEALLARHRPTVPILLNLMPVGQVSVPAWCYVCNSL